MLHLLELLVLLGVLVLLEMLVLLKLLVSLEMLRLLGVLVVGTVNIYKLQQDTSCLMHSENILTTHMCKVLTFIGR